MKLEPVNKNEIIRYLRYGNHTPDEIIMNMIDECEQILLRKITPAFTYKIFDKEILSDKTIKPGGTNIILSGNDIREHLDKCEKLLMICVTLTHETDRLIKITQVTDKTKALILDAVANAAIEQVCDKVCEEIYQKLPDYFQTSRFSPGYGDFPLTIQKNFLNILDAQKRIGVTINNENIMNPMKTVTAIVGLSKHQLPQKKRGCCCCKNNQTCEYRKAGNTCGY
ncbi:MAG: methionine synthase [Ruminococcus sp.]|nr:methionine synthase [Ruminococcus sp.]